MADTIPAWAQDTDTEVPDWAKDDVTPTVTPEQSAKKKDLLAQMAQARKEGALQEAFTKGLDATSRSIEPLTPHGLLSQPNRFISATGLAKLPDPNTTINPDFEGLARDVIAEPEKLGIVPQGTLAGPDSPVLGAAVGAGRTADTLLTPENALLAPAFIEDAAAKGGQELLKKVFAGQMAASVPEQLQQARAVVQDPNTPLSEKVAATATPVISSAFAAHMAAPTVPDVFKPTTEGVENAPQERQVQENIQPKRSGDGQGGPPTEASRGSSVRPEAAVGEEAQVPLKPAEAATKTAQVASEAPKAPETPPAAKTAPEANLGVSEPTPEKLQQVADMTGNDFANASRQWKGGMTGESYRLGRSATTPEQVADLKAKQEEQAKNYADAKKRMDFNMMTTAALKSQFFREAYEAATGTASAGESLRKSDPNYKPPFPVEEEKVETEPLEPATGNPIGQKPPAKGELVGMGGAVRHEFSNEPSARESYGIAQRVRERMARQGEGPDIQPGQGASAKDSVAHGQQLLQAGADPEAIMSNFEKTSRLSAEDMGVARAHGQELYQKQIDAERAHGTDSDEYRAAKATRDAWEPRSKAMQTQWHKIGQAQQGETGVDTGTFSGLRNAYHDATGKEFDQPQAAKAKKLAKQVSEAQTQTDAAKKELGDAIKAKPEQDPQVVAAQRALAAAQEVTQRIQREANEAAATAKPPAKPVVTDANQKALDAASKTVREAAAAKAEAENKERSATAERDKATARIQVQAADKALKAAQETARKAAERAAKEASKAGSEEAKRNAKVAKIAEVRTRKALEAAQKAVRDNAKRLADLENKRRVQQADIKNLLWQMVKDSFEKGDDDFDDVRHKVAVETGMPVEKVTELLAQDKAFKRMSDEMYKRMSDLRRFKQQAENWVKDQQTPGWLRMIKTVPRAFFAAKTAFHGTVGMITHAGINLFNPDAWSTWFPNFVKQFEFVNPYKGKGKAAHERAMQDLVRDPNFIRARRAGLGNDPFRFQDDYQNAAMNSLFKKLGVFNQGFDALKTFRQARFNQEWNRAPSRLKTPEYAEVLAGAINHSSGITRSQFGKLNEAASIGFFAPRLEASRWAWMLKDPAVASKTFLNWRNETPANRAFAVSQLKEKAFVAGTLFALLKANQGLLKATGSNQQVNTTDPHKSDFLAFKVGGQNVGVISPMLSMVRLFANLAHDSMGQRTRYERTSGSRFEEETKELGQYSRGKLSPFAGTVADVAAQADIFKRPLPFATEKEPRSLVKRGVKPYTWPEYVEDKAAPIPAEEAIREVWTDQGMSQKDQNKYLDALLTGAVAGSTGARVSKDVNLH